MKPEELPGELMTAVSERLENMDKQLVEITRGIDRLVRLREALLGEKHRYMAALDALTRPADKPADKPAGRAGKCPACDQQRDLSMFRTRSAEGKWRKYKVCADCRSAAAKAANERMYTRRGVTVAK